MLEADGHFHRIVFRAVADVVFRKTAQDRVEHGRDERTRDQVQKGDSQASLTLRVSWSLIVRSLDHVLGGHSAGIRGKNVPGQGSAFAHRVIGSTILRIDLCHAGKENIR